MPIDSAEHERRSRILAEGTATGETVESMAQRAGLKRSTFWQWMATNFPERIIGAKVTAERLAERHAVVSAGLERRASWREMGAELRACPKSLRAWARAVGYDTTRAGDGRIKDGAHIAAREIAKAKRAAFLCEQVKKPRAGKERKQAQCARETCRKWFTTEKADGAWLRFCPECRFRGSSPYEPEFGRSARQMPARRA